MATQKVKTYTVTGSYHFPIDMLRYDVSWPAREEDALNIARSLEIGGPPRIYTIRLTTHHPYSPTVARWASFSWHVVSE